MDHSLWKPLTMRGSQAVKKTCRVGMMYEWKLLDIHMDSHLNFEITLGLRKHVPILRRCGLLQLKMAGVHQESLVVLRRHQNHTNSYSRCSCCIVLLYDYHYQRQDTLEPAHKWCRDHFSRSWALH